MTLVIKSPFPEKKEGTVSVKPERIFFKTNRNFNIRDWNVSSSDALLQAHLYSIVEELFTASITFAKKQLLFT